MANLPQRLLQLLERVRSAFGGPPGMVPALALPGCSATLNRMQNYDLQQMVDDIRVLLGVPKFRTSKPKKQTRKFAYTRVLAPKTNLVPCANCGEYHEMHTICGHCYEKVRKETNEIKRKMMDYNPYIGEKQDRPVQVVYSDEEKDDDEVWKGRRIIERDVPRPSWFRKPFIKK